MSHVEDYTTNIDEQLLSAVKNQVGSHGILSGIKHEPKVHLQAHQDHRAVQAAQQAAQALYHQQQMHEEAEYNIPIPDPVVLDRLKIYPVQENTITSEGFLITCPFPEHEFQNRQDLNGFITDFARHNGFGIVIAHSNKKAIYYTCELGGRYRQKKGKSLKDQEEEAAHRQYADDGSGYVLESQTRTKKLSCPFAMTALFRKSNLVWILRTTCNEHNHPQLDPLSNHPMLRKRTEELNDMILELYKRGTKPSHIEAKIKHQFPDVLIKREDIYNEIRGYKRKLKKDEEYTGRRRNAAACHEVMEGDDDDDHDQVLTYELERQHEAEIERQLQAVAAEGHRMSHQLSHHSHLDDLQLQHYQHQLQAHDLDEHSDQTAAAAIAAAARDAGEGELSIENIDSRLVGE